MNKVLIPTKLDTVAKERLEANGFTVVQDASSSLEELVSAHSDISGLIVRSEKVTAEIIDQLPNLRLVVRAGAGFNTIDIKHARRKGVDVMNTPGANSNAVAEQVVGMVLAGYRHFVPADASTRAGKWEKKNFMGRELTDKTVGIIGLGNIGQLLVKRLKGFDNQILAFDPVLSESKAKALGVELTDLKTIFSESDVISLHVPENEHTKNMVNADLLANVKQGVTIVNCARSGVVVEADLLTAKESKGLIYLNDVYDKDEAGEKSVAPVADLMLPHTGASTAESNFNAANRAAEQTIGYFTKGITNYIVNRAAPEGLDAEYQRLAYYLAKAGDQLLGSRSPSKIEISLYGGLSEYANWLVGPIALGLGSPFDPSIEYGEATKMLEDKGIDLIIREVDDRKNYGKSMTIDLLQGEDTAYEGISIRGTIAEGSIMVSRINTFDKLYFDPMGDSLVVQYEDQPGVLATISTKLAEKGINILDVRAPQCGNESLAVFKLSAPADEATVAEIKAATNASHARATSIA
ncbi:MAG: NAD(P)-binding domain-containing protein [Lentisphaeria bacterium]|nr:NAD(P)-binding domain-containing protein [Lentisphaeria bacterium]